MDRKNIALILSIFLFMGLLFSVDYLEKQGSYDYDESCQVYSVHTGTTTSIVSIKPVKRVVNLVAVCMFTLTGILYGRREKWLQKNCSRMESLFFLKQIRVAQRMDGKKRAVLFYYTR